ncbi:MAG: hypothetical protein ACMUEM_01165 [Flavobacteriales bacterium AspAUS03]
MVSKGNTNYIISDDDNLYALIEDAHGQEGGNTTTNKPKTIKILLLQGIKTLQITEDDGFTITNDNNLYGLENNQIK